MYKQLLQLKKTPGFVILFAVIISTIIMVISVGIVSVAIKSSSLSANSREALSAFYAADSGVECALAIMKKNMLTAVSTPTVCGSGVASTVNPPSPLFSPALPINSFAFVVSYADSRTCSQVEITQSLSGTTTTGGNIYTTKVFSRGFNKCDGAIPQAANPKLLERVLEVEFTIS